MIGNSVWLTGAWWAIVKLERAVAVAPPVLTCAVTVTRSPAMNGCAGRKLSPVPVEYARRTPACTPLREPTTCTSDTCVAPVPRKLIWVLGEASGVPGSGETATGLATAVLAAVSSSSAGLTEALEPHAHRPTASASAMSIMVARVFIGQSRRIAGRIRSPCRLRPAPGPRSSR